jgi:hypothetical protein
LNPGDNLHQGYFVGPTKATMAADLAYLVGDKATGLALKKGAVLKFYKKFHDAFKAAAGGACAQMAASFLDNDATGKADPIKALLTGQVANCLSTVMVVAARNLIASGNVTNATLTQWSNAIQAMKHAGRVGGLVEIANLIANVGESPNKRCVPMGLDAL